MFCSRKFHLRQSRSRPIRHPQENLQPGRVDQGRGIEATEAVYEWSSLVPGRPCRRDKKQQNLNAFDEDTVRRQFLGENPPLNLIV